ncbi:release factor glutamine methyltransferase [Stella humosa]|uniref:Release factor glutamine methyltransferase n=1 Tax=Stella humosa TaxID=94 RepID=A0A3N1MAG7_9PROT|nr:peptide chain release factor N(5)-glutamine methyltransferase [Stella humosa]ROQ00055.1 release factor glutamine methyltransferase [Stella humosa]BBK30712.1 release factor glutamine methyltransferase [Stella humosa]
MTGASDAGSEALVADAAARLAAAGIEDARREARLILAHAALSPGQVLFPRDVRLDQAGRARFAEALARRVAREPLSRILGRREFWSLPFGLGPDALDPRPDTETLVEAVLMRLSDRGRAWRILDLGTGSGCIALALLSELPAAVAVGVDRSPAACGIARDNAHALGLGGRFHPMVADWGSALGPGGFDLVVSNPPYIPSADIAGLEPEVARHDPLAALDGGADGLSAYRRIVPDLPRLLAPGGLAGLEIGLDQAASVGALLAAAGLGPVALVADLAGHDRCLLAG